MTIEPTSGWLDRPALLVGGAPAQTHVPRPRQSRLCCAPGCVLGQPAFAPPQAVL